MAKAATRAYRSRPGGSEREGDRIHANCLKRLFTIYNRRYFKDKLPPYEIIVSTLYFGGLCDTRKRKIYLNPSIIWNKKLTRTRLIHEMAHASTNGGHGRLWRDEMLRLARLGAPIHSCDLAPQSESYRGVDTLNEFEEFGFAFPHEKWRDVVLNLGYRNGLANERGIATDKRGAALLRKARAAFLKGCRAAASYADRRRRVGSLIDRIARRKNTRKEIAQANYAQREVAKERQ